MGPALLFLSSHLAAARAEACLEGLLLLLAHAGAAGYLKNALCSVAVLGIMLPTVPDLAGKERKKHGKKWSYALHFPPGRLARWGWHGSSLSTTLAADVGRDPEGAEEGCAAGRRVRFLRLSPPTLGPIRRGRSRGAQLDGEFVSYASRRRLMAWLGGVGGGEALSWTERSLSTPLAADFGPGPQRTAEGSSSWTGSSLSTPLVPTSGLARRGGRRRGAQLDGEISSYASCRRLRAWPGGGGCAFISLGLRKRHFKNI